MSADGADCAWFRVRCVRCWKGPVWSVEGLNGSRSWFTPTKRWSVCMITTYISLILLHIFVQNISERLFDDGMVVCPHQSPFLIIRLLVNLPHWGRNCWPDIRSSESSTAIGWWLSTSPIPQRCHALGNRSAPGAGFSRSYGPHHLWESWNSILILLEIMGSARLLLETTESHQSVKMDLTWTGSEILWFGYHCARGLFCDVFSATSLLQGFPFIFWTGTQIFSIVSL